MPSQTPLKITCDVGGTFTDVVVSDPDGRLAIGKSLSTPPKLVDGLLAAIEDAASQLDLGREDALAACSLFVYSTTQATNAIIEGKVARTALLVTEGFRDILVRREGGSMHPYDFTIPFPEPYVPRRLTFEIPERVDAQGDVVRALDLAAAETMVRSLPDYGVEAIAVCLLWSTVNPAHELALGELIRDVLPQTPYTLSHELNPILREYRRASGAAMDASLKLLMQGHLGEIEGGLQSAGFAGELLAATSIGGALPMDDLIARPIYAAKSGPSLAPVAGRLFCDELGPDLIVCDTGGTSFDVSLIRDRALVTTRETWLGGFLTGHLTGMSSVDVYSIGAGGGSIAWLDNGGLLRVGPESAGASPGPACYGRGGERPTVTDAALVLGYLEPTTFLGGRMQLDVPAAQRAIDGLAEKMGSTRERVAEGIVTVANEHMVDAIKEITVNQGIDPRQSAIVAGGGAAGMNIAAIAAELGCDRVMIPRAAGALSAFGGQFTDIVIERARSVHGFTDRLDPESLDSSLAAIDTELAPFAKALEAMGVGEQRIEHRLEARYPHQVWSLEIPLGFDRFDGPDRLAEFTESFHDTHKRVFAVSAPDEAVEIVHSSGRLVAVPTKPPRSAARPSGGGGVSDTTRMVRFAGHGALPTAVRAGESLAIGERLSGPALVTEPTTTVVVTPEWSLTVTETGDYLLERV
jgi:N-methylhydantoinase A